MSSHPAAGTVNPPTMRGGRSRPLLIMSGIAVPFAASQVMGPWATPLVPAAMGAVCAVSSLRGRPVLAAMAARRAATKPSLAARIAAPGVSAALATMTAVWAVVLIAEAAIFVDLAATVPAGRLGSLGAILPWSVQAALIAVTVGFVRNRRHAVLAAR